MGEAVKSLECEIQDQFFDNLKGWMRPHEVSALLGISAKTIYDWKYRAVSRGVPNGLFVKFNSQLFIRTEVLKRWISAQNQS